jgi:DNA-binding NarL/FixJ family response regulator
MTHTRDPSRSHLPSLLIADDDPVICSLLAAQLSQSFDVVAAAGDAEQAIALAVEHRPDIAIVDMQMPAGGGLRAAREMHALTPATAIVALSADESDATVRDVIQAGAITYVRKGVAAGELAATLRRSIAAHILLSTPAPGDPLVLDASGTDR